jgi:hypothetical protein
MNEEPNDSASDDYEIGYGKPPRHTQFRKGQSGNPGGRPRGMTAGRANLLALKEAYRKVAVKERDTVVLMPAIQALLRSQVALAAKDNGPAQRAVFQQVQAIEHELGVASAAEAAKAKTKARPMTEREVARRIAFLLAIPDGKPGEPKPGREPGSANDPHQEE